MPEFPPKLQLFNKVEHRKVQFLLILTKILEYARSEEKNKVMLMKYLYSFLTKDLDGKQMNCIQFVNENHSEIAVPDAMK